MRATLLTALCVTALATTGVSAQWGAAREREVVPARPAAAPVTQAAVPLTQTAATPPAAPVPAAAAAPAPSPEPQSTTATFGDWVLRCQRLGEESKPQKSCEIAQSIQVQGQSAPVAQIAIGRRTADEPLRTTVLLPTNITLPSSVAIAADDKDQQALQLAWRRCVPGGCFADAELPADTLTRWRGLTDSGRITFQDSTGRTIIVPLSFRGVAQAVDALRRS